MTSSHPLPVVTPATATAAAGLALMGIAWLAGSAWTALTGAVLFLPAALYQAANTVARGIQ